LVSLVDFILFRRFLLPLFDYSYSNSGYSREIHRDSDNRAVVVLLYLNTLDSPDIGGCLELYRLKPGFSFRAPSCPFPPQPPSSACELTHIIHPRAGRLIVFLNQYNSYHAVSPMSASTNGRHFVYGGFTHPSSIFVDRFLFRGSRLKTEIHLY